MMGVLLAGKFIMRTVFTAFLLSVPLTSLFLCVCICTVVQSCTSCLVKFKMYFIPHPVVTQQCAISMAGS